MKSDLCMSTLLPDLVAVLDLADAEATTPIAGTRDALLVAAQGAGTDHSLACLTRAVDAHLSGKVIASSLPASSFNWGWKRPTAEHWAYKASGWRHGLARGWQRIQSFLEVLTNMMMAIMVAITLFTVSGTLAGSGVTLAFTLLIVMLSTVASRCARELSDSEKVLVPPDRLKCYLRDSAARSYLAAIHSVSDVPCVLAGDHKHLGKLLKAHAIQEEHALKEKEIQDQSLFIAKVSRYPVNAHEG